MSKKCGNHSPEFKSKFVRLRKKSISRWLNSLINMASTAIWSWNGRNGWLNKVAKYLHCVTGWHQIENHNSVFVSEDRTIDYGEWFFVQSARLRDQARRKDMIQRYISYPEGLLWIIGYTENKQLLSTTTGIRKRSVADAIDWSIEFIWRYRILASVYYRCADRARHKAGRKRVQCLMRVMGIQAIHPGLKTSKPYPQHKISIPAAESGYQLRQLV